MDEKLSKNTPCKCGHAREDHDGAEGRCLWDESEDRAACYCQKFTAGPSRVLPTIAGWAHTSERTPGEGWIAGGTDGVVEEWTDPEGRRLRRNVERGTWFVAHYA